MKESIDNYNDMIEQRNLFINNMRDAVQEKIESVCREQSRITIKDFDFDKISYHNYDESWQASVVKMLERDGYKCIISFSSEGSSLTVCWEKQSWLNLREKVG